MPRPMELLLTLCLCLLAAPLAPVVAALVARDLGRPILFHQLRAGKGGRLIRLSKFRTMSDARGADGRLLPDARRTSRTGALLRRYRLDELPQLPAILRAEIALIGPRPLLPETLAGFGEAGAIRGHVRPGLTGWAQVNGNTALGEAEKLSLDLWYVAHRGTALDLRILWLTAVTLIRGERRSEPTIAAASRWLEARPRPAGGQP